MNDNAAFSRAIRGPVILIVVGTLFALDHFASIPFDRSWPLILIAVGLLKLLHRVSVVPIQPGPVQNNFGGPYADLGHFADPQRPDSQQPPPTPPDLKVPR